MIRDKMQQTESLTDPQERKQFVSKLLGYLANEMSVALLKVTNTQASKYDFCKFPQFYPFFCDRFRMMLLKTTQRKSL